jgi:hypothetical protein
MSLLSPFSRGFQRTKNPEICKILFLDIDPKFGFRSAILVQ